jgi:uncharacterized protein YndB with AHSA1/START domain
MATMEISVVINRPVAEVCAYLNDVGNWADWRSDVLEAEQMSEGPVGVGTTLRLVMQWMGRRDETTLEVTEYEPNRKLKYWGTSGAGSAEHTYTFEPVEGGTRLTFVAEAEIGGSVKRLYGLAEPILMRMAKRHMEGSFANLKDILEAQA